MTARDARAWAVIAALGATTAIAAARLPEATTSAPFAITALAALGCVAGMLRWLAIRERSARR